MKPLPISRPCTASWEDMRPVDLGRHCDACDKDVFDLSRASEARVRALTTLFGSSGMCVRQVIGEDGELVLASQRTPLPPRRARWAGTALTLLSASGCATTAVVPSTASAQSAPGSSPRPPAPQTTQPAPVPQPDRDRDGIPDSADACPAEPGPPEAGGCPGPRRHVQVGGMPVTLPETFRFPRRGTALSSVDTPVLEQIAQVLKGRPQFLVQIIGSASDDEGGESVARELGLRRAEAVKSALISLGIEPLRLRTASLGYDSPLDNSRTAAARAQNRRVEFRLCDVLSPAERNACEKPPISKP